MTENATVGQQLETARRKYHAGSASRAETFAQMRGILADANLNLTDSGVNDLIDGSDIEKRYAPGGRQ